MDLTAAGSELLDWLREREEQMTDLLERLVLAESPSLVPGSETAALELLADALERAGMRTRVVQGHVSGDHLLACPRARRRSGRYQLILGHVDTVWPLGTIRGRRTGRDNGRFYGPGTYDMKGGLVQVVYALAALDDLGLAGRRTRAVRQLRRGGRKHGLGPVHPPARTRSGPRLRPGAARGTVGSAEDSTQGSRALRNLVTGRAAHAGTYPEEGVSAILELSHLVRGSSR